MRIREPWSPLVLSVVLATALVMVTPPVGAAPTRQESEGTAEITLPQQGETVRGVVLIVGTALHPDFNNYTLEFGFDPNVDQQWFPVQDPVGQQVQDGPLAEWDTTVVADGTYQLRLRVVRNDGQTDEFIVTGITVSNAVPTQPPTVVPSVTPSPTVGVPTPGPSPTPLIQQPPTSTPRPTATPGGPTLTPTPNPDPVLSERQIRGAVCRGAGLTMFIFVLVGAYVTLRRYARAEIRRWWLEFRREIFGRRPRGDQ
jgi:hypothetical protein